jgi:hydrogenase/urease accessory protein HupE
MAEAAWWRVELSSIIEPLNCIMSVFGIYFDLGLEHILDLSNGIDHILFVIVLCVLYQLRDWKRVLVLITAFTIGHSITLALATLQIITVPFEITEFYIAASILITALSNLFKKDDDLSSRNLQTNYFFALFFGLIHGLGFSNTLQGLLGRKENIVTQLLAFNLGLELGQIIIVAVFLVIAFIAVDLVGMSRRDWRLVISSAAAGMALLIMKDRIYW